MFGTRRVLVELAESRGRFEELLREIREIGRTNRVLHEENMEMLRFQGEVIRRNEKAFQKWQEELVEVRAESRAQRNALLAVIDERRGGGSAPAT